jgi:hypothetical protein
MHRPLAQSLADSINNVFEVVKNDVSREIQRHNLPFTYYAIQEKLVEECIGEDRTLMTDPTERYHADWDFGERYGFAEMFYQEISVEERRKLENVRQMTTVEFNRKHMTSKRGRKGFLLLKEARDMVQSLKDQNEALLYDFKQTKSLFLEEPLYCSRKADFRIVKITYRPPPKDRHVLV